MLDDWLACIVVELWLDLIVERVLEKDITGNERLGFIPGVLQGIVR
jgi:hypothetical protein